MNFLLEIYCAHLRIRIVEQLQYRVSMAIWLLEVALSPAISIAVWSAVARSQGGVLNDYTASTFAAYFIAAMLVNYLTRTWVFGSFEYRVREGQFSPMLLKPVHPIHGDVVINMSSKFLMLIVIMPMTLLLVLLFHPVFHLTWWHGLIPVVALVQAYVLRFVVEWTLGTVAFWTTRAGVLNQLYIALMLFLSGQMVPLSFFPAPVQMVANVLPFGWMVSFPVELSLGTLSLGESVRGLAMQSMWMVLSVGLLMSIWRVGVRRYSAVGA